MTGIVDAHHHIWRRKDLPWLSGPMLPRIFGPYEPIRRDYPVGEYLADIAQAGVIRSVYVQANWAKENFEAEVRFVQQTADESGWPHGIVGYADLMAADVRPELDRLKAYRLLRGIRMQLHWHDNPQYRFAARPDLMREPIFRRNMSRLADYGLSFDLQVFSDQMADAAELAADFPATTFILQHAGMLEDLSSEGWSSWREGMATLARQPNIVSKLSGLGTFIHKVDGRLIADIARDTVALFGPDRCLFGSNFPIEKLWASYDELIAAHRAALSSYAPADQEMILAGTAMKVYRLG
ncbi:MAG TPA: amidohydrolase family protein [Nordella sp.]|nr:amidohydrolase family protein [Nordella sp.]